MRRFTAVLLTVLAFHAAGCATVQKKFTRKKKPQASRSVVYLEEGPYQKRYSNEYYYKTHYTLWKSWHSELIDQLGGNHKKVERSAQEAMNHLIEIQRYLVPEKAEELAPLVDSLTQIAAKIEAGHYTKGEEYNLRAELSKIQRLVANDFYYDKVKDQILPEKVDLGAPEPDPVVPAES